jgi:hypothetical protein
VILPSSLIANLVNFAKFPNQNRSSLAGKHLQITTEFSDLIKLIAISHLKILE